MHSHIDRDGHRVHKNHSLPNDYEGDPIEAVDPSSMLIAPETITLIDGGSSELG